MPTITALLAYTLTPVLLMLSGTYGTCLAIGPGRQVTVFFGYMQCNECGRAATPGHRRFREGSGRKCDF